MEGAKYTIEECKERDATYAAPLKVRVRLHNKETDEINEHEIFMGDLPLMTETGTFVINGAERVIVSQLVRSPGIYYGIDHDKVGKLLFSCTAVSYTHLLGMVYVLRYVAFLMRLNQYDGDFHLYTHKVAYNKIRKVCELILDPHETRYFDDRIIFHVVEDREEKLIWNLRFHFFDIQSTKEAQFGFKAEAPDGSNLVFCGDCLLYTSQCIFYKNFYLQYIFCETFLT